jgi:DNA-binding transcriptional ArsR family regulator
LVDKYSLTGIFFLEYIVTMNTMTLTALAEPNRLRIVELLLKQPLAVNDIARRLGLRQPQASKHLAALSRAGLVVVHPMGQRRVYVLQDQPFHELGEWLRGFEYHRERQLDKLEEYLQEV